jgi:hypothetical protein
MTLTISLPPDALSRLEERARAKGVDVQTCAAELLTDSLRPLRSLDEISGDIYKRFLESGISDEELGEELEKAKHAMRAERRARQGS